MKNRGLWIGCAIIAILVSALACQVSIGNIGFETVRGSGNVIRENRPVSSFDRIELSGIGNLIIELGDQESLDIQAEDNLLQYIETEISGGTLVISVQDRINIQPTESINYYLTITEIEAIATSGLGSIKVPELVTQRFTMEISGGGNAIIDSLTADTLDVEISGLGNLEIQGGQVTEQEIMISGSGNYKALSMQSAEAIIDISGLGSAEVRVSDFLQAEISGSGSVRYIGSPSVDSNVTGLGKVEKINE